MKFIIISLMVFAFACTNQVSHQNNELIEITPTVNKKVPVIMDSILSDFFILKLETPEKIFLGSVKKLIFSRNRIFVSDSRMMNSVFIFDQFGIYVNHIQGGNKGPGEFINPQSITADYDSDGLYVFDDKLKKVLSYDSFGNFLSEIKFKYTADDFCKLDEETFTFNAGYPQISNRVNSYDLIYVSPGGNVMNKFLPLKEWRIGSSFNKDNAFSEYMDTVWYSPVYNDTIYQITGSGPIPTFRLNMGKWFINDELAKKINLDDPNSEYQHAIYSFIKAGSTIYLGYDVRDPESGRNVLMNVFYDISSNKTKCGQFLSGKGISNGLFTSPVSSDGEHFVGVIEAFNLKRSLELALEFGNDLTQDKMELLANISEYDNPYLVFYKVAPF